MTFFSEDKWLISSMTQATQLHKPFPEIKRLRTWGSSSPVHRHCHTWQGPGNEANIPSQILNFIICHWRVTENCQKFIHSNHITLLWKPYTFSVLKNIGIWDFPGGPVMIKNPPSNAGDTGSIPGQGTKIPHAMGQISPGATTTELSRLN